MIYVKLSPKSTTVVLMTGFCSLIIIYRQTKCMPTLQFMVSMYYYIINVYNVIRNRLRKLFQIIVLLLSCLSFTPYLNTN